MKSCMELAVAVAISAVAFLGCSAAAMNILLAAHALDLGAVWTGVYPGEDRIAKVREILAIPEGYMPLNVIPLGYPAENPPAKDKWNPEKIHADRW